MYTPLEREENLDSITLTQLRKVSISKEYGQSEVKTFFRFWLHSWPRVSLADSPIFTHFVGKQTTRKVG